MGVQLPPMNLDQRIFAHWLWQAQHCTCMAFVQPLLHHKLLQRIRKLQQAQFVGKGWLRHAKAVRCIALGAIPQFYHAFHAACLLKWVQVLPLQIFY